MEIYKRNQMEEAISATLSQGPRPSVKLRSKLKRLLDTDRASGRKPRSKNPEWSNYAFYRGDAPGRGAEVWFSSYEVFALYEGYRLMEHGLPQATVVSMLRRARPALEAKHAEILRWDPAELFDEKKIRERMKPGSLPVWTTRPVFLALISNRDTPGELDIAVLEEGGLNKWPPGTSMTTIEVTHAAHVLHEALAKTKPSKRGRGSLIRN